MMLGRRTFSGTNDTDHFRSPLIGMGSEQGSVLCSSYFSLCSAFVFLCGCASIWSPALRMHIACDESSEKLVICCLGRGKDIFRRLELNFYYSALTLQFLLTLIPSCLFDSVVMGRH